ncbi:FadR/GntR family transcriptional regulator [Streptomyces sp. H27-C3]|uniref:FadR/GntR family transcriptional regulator n=1 Tax=Streptomyces sp. H27-C3 TaxID=3046305 RepID=UPI0024BBEAFD|nr:FadR/GntR family transcriptional regulator [Streptomyces sp. H27-C3]MDJ0463368.1 FadR/GntR family transcriptional regulator [Streptomyces sp. H27-C3]
MTLSDSRTSGGVPRRISATDAVLAHLRDAIERGELTVGEKLPTEAELGKHFEVSRSVVREALRTLQALGLTVSRAGKGTYVAASGPDQNPIFGSYSARDLLEVRRHVEIPVAGYAASRRTQDDIHLLTHLIGKMEQEPDPTAWVALDTLFHISVAQASGNPVFRKIIEEIRDALARQSTFLNQLGDRRRQSDLEHRALVEAILDGSEGAAVQAMAAHLEHVEITLNAIVRPGTAHPPNEGEEIHE